MQRIQLRSRIDPQLLSQQPPHPPVGRQRIRLPPTAVQGRHQLRPQPLPQRIPLGQHLQLRHQLAMPTKHQVRPDPPLQHPQTLLGKPRGRITPQHLRGHIRQRLTTPQPKRLPQHLRLRVPIPPPGRLPGPLHQHLEPAHIHIRTSHRQHIAPGSALDQPAATQQLAQTRHVSLDHLARTGRQRLTPHRLG